MGYVRQEVSVSRGTTVRVLRGQTPTCPAAPLVPQFDREADATVISGNGSVALGSPQQLPPIWEAEMIAYFSMPGACATSSQERSAARKSQSQCLCRHLYLEIRDGSKGKTVDGAIMEKLKDLMAATLLDPFPVLVNEYLRIAIPQKYCFLNSVHMQFDRHGDLHGYTAG